MDVKCYNCGEVLVSGFCKTSPGNTCCIVVEPCKCSQVIIGKEKRDPPVEALTYKAEKLFSLLIDAIRAHISYGDTTKALACLKEAENILLFK